MSLINEDLLPETHNDDPFAESFDSNQTHAATRSLPFMAIALVAHGILLLVAALITFVTPILPTLDPIKADRPTVVIPPTPDPEETPLKELPEDMEEVEDPTIDPQIVQDAVDQTNEDPTENPLDVKNLTQSKVPSESPSPLNGPSSSVGLAGGGGGGEGGGGGGGLKALRAGGPGRRGHGHPDHVNAALQWLADHQNPKGYWSPTEYLDDSIRLKANPRGTPSVVTHNIDFKDDPAVGGNDIGFDSGQVGLTGLALLAFAGDGNTHRDGRFRTTVRAAITWLRAQQDAEGCYGARDAEDFVYNHAISTMAMAEVYAMTNDMALRLPAQKAVDFIVAAQNPGMGWRYGVQPRENDSSVTAWMVLALKSAALGNLKFPAEEVYAGANAWFDKATGKNDFGYEVTGYNATAVGNARLAQSKNFEQNPSMDACSVMVRLFSGNKPVGDRKLLQQASLMTQNLPVWYTAGDESKGPYKIDMYYWYYASLALFQIGGSHWETWEKALIRPILTQYQRGWHNKDRKMFEEHGNMITRVGTNTPDEGRWLLDEHGSWDPVGPWGPAGGRVYSTAINALTLEVYYRYERQDKSGK